MPASFYLRSKYVEKRKERRERRGDRREQVEREGGRREEKKEGADSGKRSAPVDRCECPKGGGRLVLVEAVAGEEVVEVGDAVGGDRLYHG